MWDICNHVDADKRYFIYGKELLGRFCCDKLCEKYGDDKVIGFIETHPLHEPFDGWKEVFSPDEAKKQIDDTTGVIITGRASSEAMREVCLNMGVREENLVFPHALLPYLANGYQSKLETVCLWPPVEARNPDMMMKLKWFAPSRVRLKIFTSNPDVVKELPVNADVCIEPDAGKIMERAGAILLWDVGREDGLQEKYSGKLRVVDPTFYESVDMLNYLKIYHSTFSREEKEDMRRASLEVFKNLIAEGKRHKAANVFCSGPSISEVYEMPSERFKDGFNIICNSMVKDREFLARIRPSVQVFLDTNFFHSPGLYGDAFYKDLLWAYEKYHFYLVVWEFQYPLLATKYPQMKERLIGVPFIVKPKEYWFISPENFRSNSTKNVLTEIMLPIASSACDKIGIAGCTGRGNDGNYFWQHNDRTQYNDLKKYVMEEWPAFFKYRKYDSYFARHCQTVEEMLEYGESIGKKYINLTTSFIPALSKRDLSENESREMQ